MSASSREKEARDARAGASRDLGGSELDRSSSLLARARALGIPWERILRQELRAEETLRACLSDLKGPWTLREVSWLLPSSLLQSWRVRARIERLAWEAFAEDSSKARRELLVLSTHLRHRRRQNSAESIRARHLWLAYERVLTLMKVSRAAEKFRGLGPRSLEFLRGKTGCSQEDGKWAVARANAVGRGHRLNDCMERAREEGFEIPHAISEFEALGLMRKFVRKVFPPMNHPPGSRGPRAASHDRVDRKIGAVARTGRAS